MTSINQETKAKYLQMYHDFTFWADGGDFRFPTTEYIMQNVAENVCIVNSSFPRVESRQAYIDRMPMWRSMISVKHHVLDEYVSEDGWVHVFFASTATFWNSDRSKVCTTFNPAVFTRMRIDDEDKIAEVHSYWDGTDFMTKLMSKA